MEDGFEEVLKMKSWVTTSSPSEVVDYEIVNHMRLFRMEVVSGKSVQLSLDELNLNSSVVDMTVGDGR